MPDSMEKLARDIRRMNKDQKLRLKNIQVMAAAYLDVLERELPDGRNKTWMIRHTKVAADLAPLVLLRPNG
jgi:hypothetical protein